MTSCAQVPDLLAQAQQSRQDLDDPAYCDGFPDPLQCRRNPGAQKQKRKQEMAQLLSEGSSRRTGDTVLTGIWHMMIEDSEAYPNAGRFSRDTVNNDHSWSGRTVHQVLAVMDNTIISGFWNGATLELSFDAPGLFDPIGGSFLSSRFSGMVDLNAQPLSIRGEWRRDLPSGEKETQLEPFIENEKTA